MPGDKVMLKSGGPSMTVIDVGASTDLVWCRWMRRGEQGGKHVDGDVAENYFPPAALIPDSGVYHA